jgi:hypothetical protein
MNAKTNSRPNFPTKTDRESGSFPLQCEEVAAVAYGLYVQNGRRDGHDQEDWFQAGRQLQESKRRSEAKITEWAGEIPKDVQVTPSQPRARAKEKTECSSATRLRMTKDSSPRQTAVQGKARSTQSPAAIRPSSRAR